MGDREAFNFLETNTVGEPGTLDRQIRKYRHIRITNKNMKDIQKGKICKEKDIRLWKTYKYDDRIGKKDIRVWI